MDDISDPAEIPTVAGWAQDKLGNNALAQPTMANFMRTDYTRPHRSTS